MSALRRTNATNAITGVESRTRAAAVDASVATGTTWYVPGIHGLAIGHKYPHRRPRT